MREIKEDINRWKDRPCSWIGRLNIVKMTVLPKAICWFNTILIQLPMTFLTELEQKILKFVWRYERPQIAKQPWNRKTELEESGSLTSNYTARLPSSKQYSSGTKNRNLDQWNRIEKPEISPCDCSQLIYDKKGKSTQCWKDSLFNKWCWESQTAM